MEEIWKDIDGYEGLYQVSNLGNVKSLNYRKTEKEHTLSPTADRYGYMLVGLWKNCEQKRYQVHRLVAEAFLDKKDFKYVNEEDRLKYVNNLDKLEVNHKDEKPKNNNVSNLEWCTRWYNMLYGTGIQRASRVRSKAMRNHPKLSKKVYQYDLNGNFINEWLSVAEVERQTRYSHSHIRKCCNGEHKTAYDYIWSYDKLTKEELEDKIKEIKDIPSTKAKKIYQYDLNGNLIKIWSSMCEIERQTRYSIGNICSCCKGRYKQAYGYIWRYEEVEKGCE